MSIIGIPMTSDCSACGKVNKKAYRLNYTSFQHLDFSPLGVPETWLDTLSVCDNCGVFYRLLDVAQHKMLAAIYQSVDYAEHQEDHMVLEGETLRRASDAQADALLTAWPDGASSQAILDIGCFDGKLLKALSQQTTASRLVGYDIAPRPNFPAVPGFEFHSGDRKNLSGLFNIILLSQCLIYISDLVNFFTELDGLLANNGRIFVHVPNSSLRPASLLLADQVFHFTPESIERLFSTHGYRVDFLKSHPFTRDILMFAYRDDSLSLQRSEMPAPEVDIFEHLKHLASLILAVPGEDIAIFGTTIEAAFAHSLIADRVCCFVDENPRKQADSFNGLPVMPPQALSPKATCIIPMGQDAAPLASRLSTTFSANFLLV